ncbi:MAG: contractile injection system tape measure protein, partial [Phycisphaerales bacterium]
RPTPTVSERFPGDAPAQPDPTAERQEAAPSASPANPRLPTLESLSPPTREGQSTRPAPQHARAPDSESADFPTAGSSARWTALDAGIVLLHPFLPTLLGAIRATEGTPSRIRDEQRPHAAAALHHLLTGSDQTQEFELTVIKALLGVSPGDPLEVGDARLTDATREECDALLLAVTTHWPSLRGSSVDSLRSAFLDRAGILRDTGPAWLLTVEPKPFDALLATVPWNTTFVVLPWMTKPLQVDWPKV